MFSYFLVAFFVPLDLPYVSKRRTQSGSCRSKNT
nr:MAG TPA_asm: hypothetical protein [Caudoviricetes sp.]